MNYGFQYNSQAESNIRIQPFAYNNAISNEYLVSYGRDIFSDLRKFNAPLFVMRKRRGVFFDDTIKTLKPVKQKMHYTEQNQAINERIIDIRIPDIKYVKKHNYNRINQIYKDLIIKKITSDLNIFDSCWANENIVKHINVLNLVTLKDKKFLNIYNNYFVKNKKINNTVITKDTLLKDVKLNKTLLSNEKLFFDKDIIINLYPKEFFASAIKHNDIQIIKETSLSLIKDKSINMKQEIFAQDKYVSDINLFNVINIANLNHSKNIFYKNNISVARPSLKFKIYTQADSLKDKIVDKVIQPNDYVFITKKDLFKSQVLKSVNISLSFKDVNVINTVICLTKDSKESFLSKPSKFYRKYKKKLSKKKVESTLKKDIVLGEYIRKNISGKKAKELLEKNHTEAYFKKYRHLFDINNINIFSKKDRHSFIVNNTEKYILSNSKGFSIQDTDINIYKDSKFFAVDNVEQIAYKNRKEFAIKNKTLSTEVIYRNQYKITTSSEVHMKELDIPFNLKFHDNTIGLLISSEHININDKMKSFKKKYYKGFLENIDRVFEKEKRQTENLLDLYPLSKEKYEFIMDYHPKMVIRNIKNSVLKCTEQFVAKGFKDGIIYNIINAASKTKKNVELSFNDIFLNKIPSYTNLFDKDIIISKHEEKTNIDNNSLWINKRDYQSGFFDTEFTVDKDVIEAFVAYDELVFDKATIDIDLDSNLFINKTRKGILFEESNLYISKRDLKTNTENLFSGKKQPKGSNISDYILISRKEYETHPIVAEIQRMKKVIKDLEKPVEKTYNWAYVYQYEDPIDPNYEHYGLDELLLPEKDVDYSSFEDIIFNKKTMKPKYPIKILDDNTFIAKYPIKHPIPEYEEIGIEYVDVPSNLMYEIFIKFYQVWYSNIFKFGNMSMIESMKLMLDYIYSYITLNYTGSEYLEPALRVFRLIRWFGETSVMHNAQYKITFEYEDLKSNLQSGACMIPNEMIGMSVDTSLKVIASDSTNFNKDAYINLYVQNKESTKITFSISFVGGVAEIYLNDELIDVLSYNQPSVTYELPETDDTNKFVIKRPASSNNNYCYIGNIVVKNGAYKNLNINYDPDLKAGNMPLNDVVNKMVILANMYDNESEMFEQFRKGNLGISELYKKLQNYWELHHAGKEKGKRLTIKET